MPGPRDPAELDDGARRLIEGPPRPPGRRGRRDGWLVVALAAVVLGAGLLAGGGGSDGAPPPECPDVSAPADRVGDAGFSEGSGLLVRGDDELEPELAGIAATGVRYLRVDFDWSGIGRREGELDWDATDRVVQPAQQCGLEVLGLLTYTPEWARPDDTGTHHPPTDAADFADFAAEAVRRFAPQGVHTWEIWNEPNVEFFWEPAPDAADYAELLIAAYDAIKEVDPDALVLTGGLAPAPDADDGSSVAPATFLQGVYDAGAGGQFDAVAHHPYSYPLLPLESTGENAFVDVTPQLYEVMTAQGDGDLEIWGTEMGAPTGGVITLDFLAQYITQAYEAWRDWSFTGPLFWYSYRDAGENPDDREANFGLVKYDLTPKEPALDAFVAVVND